MLDSEAPSPVTAPGLLKSCSLEPPAELRRPSVDCVESLSRIPEKMPEFRLDRPSSAAGIAPGAGRSPVPDPGIAPPCTEDLAGDAWVLFAGESRPTGDA